MTTFKSTQKCTFYNFRIKIENPDDLTTQKPDTEIQNEDEDENHEDDDDFSFLGTITIIHISSRFNLGSPIQWGAQYTRIEIWAVALAVLKRQNY